MALRPIRNFFLFVFFDDTAEGKFIDRAKSGIILTNQDAESQGKYARWGKVLSVGPDITDFGAGDIVLIERGMWTPGFDYDEVKIWKSDAEKVMAIAEDASVTYSY